MTTQQMEKITEYRQAGYTQGQIAEMTGLSISSIKSFLRRHAAVSSDDVCPVCGKAIRSKPHHKAKRFCSDHCRLRWWNSHPEQVNRTRHSQVCAQCGVTFETHIASQRFCSRSCASAARRKKADDV